MVYVPKQPYSGNWGNHSVCKCFFQMGTQTKITVQQSESNLALILGDLLGAMPGAVLSSVFDTDRNKWDNLKEGAETALYIHVYNRGTLNRYCGAEYLQMKEGFCSSTMARSRLWRILRNICGIQTFVAADRWQVMCSCTHNICDISS